MVKVASSNLSEVGFKDGILKIIFKSGDSWLYFDVPEDLFEELLNAESCGSYFIQNVKSRYREEKCEI